MIEPKELCLGQIPSIDRGAQALARKRLDSLTKPTGSLGALEEAFVALAGMQAVSCPEIRESLALVFAGDHGVVRHGVSAYPQAVTGQMLSNFDRRGAAINVFAPRARAKLIIVDVGVIGGPEGLEHVQIRRVGLGTKDFLLEPAMERGQVIEAIQVGKDAFKESMEEGTDLLLVGEMGIGNTTSASAITAVMCGCNVREVTGAGTGLTLAGVEHKISIIERSIERSGPSRRDPLGVLAELGGFEICALIGAMIEAARNRIPILLDGFVTGSAALMADALVPGLKEYMIAGHLSPEPGHAIQLRHLGLAPLLNLQLRLGEGTGAALALPLLQSICDAAGSMATFQEASVSSALPTSVPDNRFYNNRAGRLGGLRRELATCPNRSFG